MTQKQLDMLKEFEVNVKQVVNLPDADRILTGLSALKPNTNKVKIAQWVKGAIDQLDMNLPEPQKIKIMEACGNNCAKMNPRAVGMLKKKRQKYSSFEAFLEAEEHNPQNGTKIKRDGQAIIQIYTPQEFSHPMRCFCGLVNGLPADQTLSKTYCQCSKALVQKMWEQVLEKPVQVEVLKTALSGDSECHFRITY